MADAIHVMVVDDEPDLCEMLKATLQQDGAFKVTTVSDPTIVEDVIREEPVDVILLDIVMPGRSGREIIAALKADETLKDIPIIVISGKGEMVYDKKKDSFKWEPNSKLVKERGPLPSGGSAEQLAEAYGVDDYVNKPFAIEILKNVIKDVLERKRGGLSEDDDLDKFADL